MVTIYVNLEFSMVKISLLCTNLYYLQCKYDTTKSENVYYNNISTASTEVHLKAHATHQTIDAADIAQ